MMNSVHSARWLAQFKDSDLDFYIFPSTYFKKVHPLINSLVESHSSARYYIQYSTSSAGWIDYFQERILKTFSQRLSRKYRLNRLINSVKPEVVHALEFQHAAYLCSETIDSFGKNFEFIATNWGSDIYHFMDFPDHNIKIRSVLALADKYSAECARDYKLAASLGFKGQQLPVIPNSGGFSTEILSQFKINTSKRDLILVKSYGGYFGRSKLIIEALRGILAKSSNSQIKVHFYSVTEDLVADIKQLVKDFPKRITFTDVGNPLSHAELLELFATARLYLGCSISDGISTSFLEALALGAFPIQTNTSCASEWIDKGAMAKLVSVDEQSFREAIESVIDDCDLLDKAQLKNSEVAKRFLSQEYVQKIASTFYAN